MKEETSSSSRESGRTSPETPKYSGIVFTDSQKTNIARAISLFSFIAIVAMLYLVCSLAVKFFSAHSTVLMPPAIAIVLAMFLQPLYNWIYEHTFRKHWIALTVIAAIVLVPAAAFLYMFGSLVLSQIDNFISSLPAIASGVNDWISKNMPDVMVFLKKYKIPEMVSHLNPENLINASAIAAKIGTTAASVGSFLVSTVSNALGWFALPIYTALLLVSKPFSGSDVKKFLVFASPHTRDNAAFLIDQFLNIVVAFFRGQVLVALIQGILFGLGFQLIGLSYGMLIGLTLGILNIVPYLGNMVGLSVTIPIALFGHNGGVELLALTLLVFCAVQTVDAYFITPKIMQNKTGLNPFAVIFSLFFWSSVIGGAIGMLLAIPLSAFITVFLQWLRREYFRQYMDGENGETGENT